MCSWWRGRGGQRRGDADWVRGDRAGSGLLRLEVAGPGRLGMGDQEAGIQRDEFGRVTGFFRLALSQRPGHQEGQRAVVDWPGRRRGRWSAFCHLRPDHVLCICAVHL